MVTGYGRIERAVRVWLPVGFFLVVALLPFYWMAITSLKPNSELYNKHITPLIVFHPTLKHYVDLLSQTNFLLWTWNTMVVAVVATAISLVLGMMLAYPLARMRFAGVGLIATTVAAIYLVPQPLLFMPLADIINRLHLGNTLTSVILTYPTMLVPFCAWLLLGYFKTVPKDLEEAARIDGASRLQTMRRIFLPLCTPGFISAGIFAFTLSQNEFLYALIFLTKTSVRTVPVGVIAELIRGDVFYWGQLMAGALLGSIPVAIIYSFFVEHYVAGLTSGVGQGLGLWLIDGWKLYGRSPICGATSPGGENLASGSGWCRQWGRCTTGTWRWSARRARDAIASLPRSSSTPSNLLRTRISVPTRAARQPISTCCARRKSIWRSFPPPTKSTRRDLPRSSRCRG